MADILIRGIEFPQCCVECPFQASRWTGDFCSAGQFMVGIDFDYRQKHKKCPLVPLPKGHGRLIDADAIEYTYTTVRGNDDGHNWRIFAVGQDEIDDMPTIVPAEGGTDE